MYWETKLFAMYQTPVVIVSKYNILCYCLITKTKRCRWLSITLVSLHNRWLLTFACLDIFVSLESLLSLVNIITQKVSYQLFLFSTVSSFQSVITNYLPMMRGEKLMEKYFHVVENIINRETILLSRETFQPQNFTDFHTK